MRIYSLAAAISMVGVLFGAGAASAMSVSSVAGPSLIQKADVVVSKTTVVRRPPPRVIVRKRRVIVR